MTRTIVPGLALVVDDVEGNRVLAQAYLERIGWQVCAFSDAQSALDHLENVIPEAMLIDVRMPGFRGDLLATILRADPPTAGIRLIGYTAHAFPDEVAVLRASGFEEVLIKPVLMRDMARVFPLVASGPPCLRN